MDEQQLAAIEARANAASPPPWKLEHVDDGEGYGWVVAPLSALCLDADSDYAYSFVVVEPDEDAVQRANAEFLLHARDDVPALIAEVRRLQTEGS